MQIKQIKLKNFKCFKHVELDFSRITLITGANSSGKSSLLYGILSAAQSNEFPYTLNPNGKYVNMGDFDEFVFHHDRKAIISIDFTFSNDDGDVRVNTEWTRNNTNYQPEIHSLKIDTDDSILTIKKIRKYHFKFKSKKTNLDFQFLKQIHRMVHLETVEHIDEDKETIEKHKALVEKFIESDKTVAQFTLHSLSSLSKITDNFQTNSSLMAYGAYNQIYRAVSRAFSQFNFLSSFRLYPERTYYEKPDYKDRVGRFGEGYQDQIINWDEKKSPRFKALKKSLNQLGLVTDISKSRIKAGRFEIRVQPTKNGVDSALNDVGFGISQILPLLVADIQLGNDSTLIAAQPEIHLHPSVQAELGNYFADNILSSNKRYLLETHSQYLINRIRLLIVEGKIKQEDVNCYYFENDGKMSNVHRLTFGKNGVIKGAPKSFFNTYMTDAMKIAKGAVSD